MLLNDLQYDVIYRVKKNNYRTIAVVYFDVLGDVKVSVLDVMGKFKQYTTKVFMSKFKSAERGVELFDLITTAIRNKQPRVFWVQLKNPKTVDYQIKFTKIKGKIYGYACRCSDDYGNEIVMSGYNGKEYPLSKAVFVFDLSSIISDDGSKVQDALERKYVQLEDELKGKSVKTGYTLEKTKGVFESIFADLKEKGIVRESDKATLRSILEYITDSNTKEVSPERLERIKDTVIALNEVLLVNDSRVYFGGVERIKYSNKASELYYKFIVQTAEETINQVVLLFSSEDKYRDMEILTSKALRNGDYAYVVSGKESEIRCWDIIKNAELQLVTGDETDKNVIKEDYNIINNMKKYLNLDIQR